MQQAKRLSTLLIAAVLALTAGAFESKAQTATVFEGARLITGDGSTPIEDSAFVIEAGRITAVGRRGEVRRPRARRASISPARLSFRRWSMRTRISATCAT